MNILVIGRCLPDGRSSYGTFEMAQAKALAEVGYNVVYGYSDNRSVKVNRRVTFCAAPHDGVFACGDVVPVGGLPLGVVSWFKTHGLCKVLDRFAANGFAPDLVYAHFPLLTLTEDFLSELKRRGIPLVCMEHWTLVQRRMLPKARIALLRRVVEEARAFCCVGDDLRGSVLWYCGDKWADKLYVVPNIVDEGLFNVGAVSLPRAAGGGFVVAGRLSAVKRFDFLLRAFASADTQGAHLVIAGDGEERRALVRLARALRISDRVDFAGWLSSAELAKVMQASACYVSASDDETFGVPLAEAWMCGLPCIAPDCNPLRAQFAPWNGILFQRESEADLARCLEAVVAADGGYQPARISAWAASLYSKAAVVERLENVWTESIHDFVPTGQRDRSRVQSAD